MPTSSEIRRQFLDFFVQKHGHTFVPSSPVVPLDDPTLLFTNAGMNQFKPIFLGQEKRSYTRATNTQKCIRAGGKHNDLDDVGRSRRHHTFFEMLGNWSFGDYFKRGAIEMAWELLTKVWQLDPTRLHVSCYEGNPAAGIPRDDEAADLWKEIAKIPDDHIHYFGKDNFWEMGDTGPCGPCTEIYIDRTPDKTGGPSVNGDDPRVMEIWNLVFIQYNRDAAGKLTPLPAKHVDTGMGFERICQVLQGKEDNYATDLWTPLFAAISEISGLKYTGLFTKTNAADPAAETANPQLRHDIAFRVIADHARCLTFALTDGAVPSNEGRGYVLRRILRRAARFGRQQLSLVEPFIYRLVPVIIDSMAEAFPELKRDPNRVMELIKEEEISFGRTLSQGLALFDHAIHDIYRNAVYEKIAREHPGRNVIGQGGVFGVVNPRIQLEVRDSSTRELVHAYDGGPINANSLREVGASTVFPASTAFRLHDTHGFPIDLTRIMAEERGMSVDMIGYEKLMEQAKELARSGGRMDSLGVAMLPPEALERLSMVDAGPTDDSPKFSHEPLPAKVLAIWDGYKFWEQIQADNARPLAIILDRTNFYSEMGGQVGDRGQIRLLSPSPGTPGEGRGEGLQRASQALTPALSQSTGRGGEEQAVFDVETTRAVGGYVLHIGRLRSGTLRVGDQVQAVVLGNRDHIEKNHTATHLANWALREILGEGVQQKGSLVDAEKLRFDFSHSKAMSDEEIARVEQLVEREIQKQLPVYAEEAPQEKALKINGLRAVFGEKYPERVRVVSIGAKVDDLLADPTNPKWREFSIEFCGGTHLGNSSQVGRFAIVAEESVSKGVRRLVAFTGESAANLATTEKEADGLIAKSSEATGADLSGIISSLQKLSAGSISLRAKRKVQAAVGQLQARYKAFEKKSAKSESGGQVDAIAEAGKLLESAMSIGAGKLIIGQIVGASSDQLRGAIDSLRKKSASHAIMLATVEGESATFVAAVSDDLVAKGIKAGDWVKKTAAIAGGGGGGRPQMAQGSGKDAGKIADALTVAKEFAVGAVGVG
jgi:alanyl-tRNA synthetase